MLRKVFGTSFVLAAMAMVPMFARADFQAGNWDLQVGGNGIANHEVNAATFGLSGQLGYFLTKNLEVGLHQTFNYAEAPHTESALSGTTSIVADWNFDFGNFVPFAGGNIGYSYGNHATSTRDTWAAGPEGGLKYFLNSSTYLYGSVAYEFLFNTNHAGSSGFVYSVGLGVALK
jgi:hypothetical protein